MLDTLSADEEIAFQKTTVHPESNNPVWEQQFTLPVPNANESQLEITLWYMQRTISLHNFTSSPRATQTRPRLTLQLTRFRDLGEVAEEEDESFLGEVVRMYVCVCVCVCARARVYLL